MEKGSEVGMDTWSFELALATAIEKSEWNLSFEVELALEKSEESQFALMENLSTLTELERGIEDLSDSEFLENLPSLESESFLRRLALTSCSPPPPSPLPSPQLLPPPVLLQPPFSPL